MFVLIVFQQNHTINSRQKQSTLKRVHTSINILIKSLLGYFNFVNLIRNQPRQQNYMTTTEYQFELMHSINLILTSSLMSHMAKNRVCWLHSNHLFGTMISTILQSLCSLYITVDKAKVQNNWLDQIDIKYRTSDRITISPCDVQRMLVNIYTTPTSVTVFNAR